jgi:5-methylcytosine-specific restriction protein A
MFPVRLKSDGVRPLPSVGAIHRLEQIKEKALKRYSKTKLKQLANKAKSKPAKRPAHTDDFVRNPYVAAYVKRMADGKVRLMPISQHPSKKMVSRSSTVIMFCGLREVGQTSSKMPSRFVPNCHERMHQLDHKADIAKLSIRIGQREPDLTPFDVFGSFQGKPFSAAIA